MGEAEGGQVTVLLRELGKAINDDCELVDDKRKSFADEDQVRIAACP